MFENDFIINYLGWLTAVSFFTFILSLLFIPWLIGRLSADCFLNIMAGDNFKRPMTFFRIIGHLFRNIIGIFLICAGIAMLFLPGQGILTIIMGLFLFSFPGKKRLLAMAIRRPAIRRSLNWFRTRQNIPPFNWPDD